MKESAVEGLTAPEPKAGKGAQKKPGFPNGRAGTMNVDGLTHTLKGAAIDSTPKGLNESMEPAGTTVERKLTAEANKSAKAQGTEPMLRASPSK